jgi:hypothetical protein
MTDSRPFGRRQTGHRSALAVVALSLTLLAGCSIVALPTPAVRHDPSLAHGGALGYVVCPNAVTPVELATRTAEAEIPLPISGTPVLGNFAMATSADGRWAYVVTSNGVPASASATATTVAPATTSATTSAEPSASSTSSTGPVGPSGVENVVIPIDLVAQRALRPIPIPGQGGTHAIVVTDGGRAVLASSGSTIVPVDVRSRHVGRPLDLGPGRTIFGMAVQNGTTLYALVAGGVFPVHVANLRAGAEISTGLSVSSVYSPHGLALAADGSTLYVVGQGGVDFGGRVLVVATTTGATEAVASFDKFGIADPAAVAVSGDGASLLVVDSANNWVNPLLLSDLADPPAPIRLPQPTSTTSASGTEHPTDIVIGPGRTGSFVVDGFSEVIPYTPGSERFGTPIRVCSGASSMAVAPEP